MTINTEELTKEEKQRYWQEQVSAWESSGISQAEFCRRHNLKVRNFGYWKRMLHKVSGPACAVRQPVCRPDGTGRHAGRAVTFVPLRVQSPHSQGIPLELILEDGLRIGVREGFSPSALKELIYLLRQL